MLKSIFWIIGLELIGSLIIHWLGLIPGDWLWGFIGEMMQVLLPVLRISLAFGAAFVAGTKVSGKSIVKWKSTVVWITIITFLASLSIYYFDYWSFQSRLAKIFVEKNITVSGYSPKELVDVFLEVKTGSSGIVGYLLISPQREASIEIEDETLTIPKSGMATGLNWIFRLLTIGATIFVAYRGAVLGIIEKLKSIKEGRKVSFASIGNFAAKLLEE
jgi:hypothetical protein